MILLIYSSVTLGCGVTDSIIIGVYKHTSGDNKLRFLDLFWEHGSYIFNAENTERKKIIGNWELNECKLSLTFLNNKKSTTINANVVSLNSNKLVLNYSGAKENAVLIKNGI